MAEKFLNLQGLTTYDEKIKELIDNKDASVLLQAKTYAENLEIFDPAGTAATLVGNLEEGAVAANTAAIATLNGSDTTAGSVAKAVKDAKDELDGKIGDTSDLDTTAKNDLVSAINEVRQSVEAGGTSATITIDTKTTTEGFAKSYTIKQGTSTVGVIDIPKDMVVSSGAVETNPSGQDAGTYLVLTLANATEDKVYINVGTLVDIYTAQASATQVQLTINPGTREISAAIVAGSVTATELANSAVTTVKIADGNVTKAKLASAVQSSLDLADSALQKADITTGTANGSVAVDGTDVPVKGLASAAYRVAGSAENNVPVVGTALGTTANVPVVTNASGQLAPHASGALGSAAFANTSAFDAAGTAASAVSTLQNGQVATNASNISTLQGQVASLQSDAPVAITNEEIEALFA